MIALSLYRNRLFRGSCPTGDWSDGPETGLTDEFTMDFLVLVLFELNGNAGDVLAARLWG